MVFHNMAEIICAENSNGGIGVGFGDTGNSRDYMAQSFILGEGVRTITAVTFQVNGKDGNTNYGWRVWIAEADTTNRYPVGTPGVGVGPATLITNAQIVTSTYTKYTLNPVTGLNPGSRYCICFEPYDTTNLTHVAVYQDFDSSNVNPYSFGRRVHSGDFSSWNQPDSGNLDMKFRIWGLQTELTPHNMGRRVRSGNGMSVSDFAR